MAGYLTAAGANRDALLANLVVWIFMALLLGMAGSAISALGLRRHARSRAAAYCSFAGAPILVVAYTAWLAFVVQIVPDTSDSAVLLAEVMGWFALRLDWISSILLVGIGPTLLALSGRGVWAPSWLVVWGYVTALAAALTAVAMLTGGAGLTTYGFLVVPAGIFWMIAAGIVLLRWQGGNR